MSLTTKKVSVAVFMFLLFQSGYGHNERTTMVAKMGAAGCSLVDILRVLEGQNGNASRSSASVNTSRSRANLDAEGDAGIASVSSMNAETREEAAARMASELSASNDSNSGAMRRIQGVMADRLIEGRSASLDQRDEAGVASVAYLGAETREATASSSNRNNSEMDALRVQLAAMQQEIQMLREGLAVRANGAYPRAYGYSYSDGVNSAYPPVYGYNYQNRASYPRAYGYDYSNGQSSEVAQEGVSVPSNYNGESMNENIAPQFDFAVNNNTYRHADFLEADRLMERAIESDLDDDRDTVSPVDQLAEEMQSNLFSRDSSLESIFGVDQQDGASKETEAQSKKTEQHKAAGKGRRSRTNSVKRKISRRQSIKNGRRK